MVSSSVIADYVDGVHIGDEVDIRGFHSIDQAKAQELTFCIYDDEDLINSSSAGAVITAETVSGPTEKTIIQCENPRIGFIKVVREFFTDHSDETEIHPSAVVEDGAEIGAGCQIGANVYIHESVTVGDNCTIMPSTSIGLESFGFTRDEEGRLWNHVFKGNVVIEDDVWIGAGTAIDRGMFDTTKIGEGTKIQNLVHVGHETHIGRHALINQLTSLAGNVQVGDEVRIHPAVSVAGYVEIGDYSEVGTNSTVLEDVPPRSKMVGAPAEKIGEVDLQTTSFDVDSEDKMG